MAPRGQFNQQDPIALAGGANSYGFADGDPVNYADPFGLCALPGWQGKVACAAAIVAAKVASTPTGQRVVQRGSELARNLAESGAVRQAGEAAHHIVARAARAAAPAREALARAGVRLNEAVNGVNLPATRESMSNAANHLTLHTQRYYRAVNDAMANVNTRQEAIEVLDKIRSALRDGTFPR